MAMSKEEMEKEHDYQMREKVALEEEASWVKLCSKVVSVYQNLCSNNIALKKSKIVKIVKKS